MSDPLDPNWKANATARQREAMRILENIERLVAMGERHPTDVAAEKRRMEADARAAKARKLRAQGKSHSAIAAELDVHPTTVPRLLKRPIPPSATDDADSATDDAV